MGNSKRKGSDSSKALLGILLIALIIIGDIVSGAIGIAGPVSSCPQSPISPCLTHFQNSFGTCTILTSTNQCSITQTFSPAFTIIPQTHVDWNGTPAVISSTTAGQSLFYQYNSAFQAVNVTAWANMPTNDNPVELYGDANQRLQIPDAPTGATVLALMCVDVVAPSNNSTATIDTQFSTNSGSTWNEFSLLTGGPTARLEVSINNPGEQCQSANEPHACDNLYCPATNFPTASPSLYASFLVRVVGRDGAGNVLCSPTCVTNMCDPSGTNSNFGTFVDCPSFGTIQFLWTVSNPTSFSITDSCYPFLVSVTVTTIKFGVFCYRTPSASSIVNVKWDAGIPA